MGEQTKFDENTLETLKRIHAELELEDDVEDEICWQDIKPLPRDVFIDRVISLKDRIYNIFKKSKSTTTEMTTDYSLGQVKSGDEITRELEDAWNLYTKGCDAIPSRCVGYILRILGQNPTEDEIVDMVMRANCEWDGLMTKSDFLGVSVEVLRQSCDEMDDVKAAFRVFDHNNDGDISKVELRDAMVNFGTRFTDEEFELMFAEADQNDDGLIDFDEFVLMMLPSSSTAHGAMNHN